MIIASNDESSLPPASQAPTADRSEMTMLAQEQAALRRVATLVGRESSSVEVFGAVTEEVARVLGTEAVGMLRFESDGTATLVAQSHTPWDPPPLGTRFTLESENVIARVLRTGQAARLDDWANTTGSVAAMARSLGIRSSVATPIVVEGRLWGTMIAATSQSEPLPADTESRIGQFTELVATAISNADARGELSRLVEEQAALRRVATLVAQGVPAGDLCGAVAEEVGRLLDADLAGMIRYVSDTITAVATWAAEGEHPEVRGLWPLEGEPIATTILRTRRPAREDNWAEVEGPIAAFVLEEMGVQSSVGSPVIVEGTVWGALFVHSKQPHQPLPRDTESRLTNFAELIATAISNAQARGELRRLADEQAALRRVATLVARGVPPTEVFAAVAREVGQLLEVDLTHIGHYEQDGTAIGVASWSAQGDHLPVGTRASVEGENVTALVQRSGRPARLDSYDDAPGSIATMLRELGFRSSVGAPIVVDGRLWGVVVASSKEQEPLAPDTEARITAFTELVATAIANAQARAELQRLADEQAALRRVATLVAEGAAPTEVFDAVIVEVAQLFGAAQVGLARYENDHEISVLAIRGQEPALLRAGIRLPLDGNSLNSRILRTRRSARLNLNEEGSGTIAELLRRSNVNVSVGAPIVVEGSLWGMIGASWKGQDVPPADVEQRLAQFAEQLATAIANADSRDQLTASRARVLTAGDEARRRVVRDLHDGGQQRLVHAIVTLKLAQQALSEDTERAESLLAEALGHAEQGNAELRELAHGILPSVLTRGGLRGGVNSLVSRLDLPVETEVTSTRLPPQIEASAYFIVAEALTNVIKHSHATRAEVTAAVEGGTLSVEVRDDGIGGANPEGHGLLGISDRVAALGGRLHIESPRGGGTVLAAELPLSDMRRK